MMAIVASALVVEAPVRAADLGGWSDTWFAGRGRVCNVAVSPGVVVRVTPSGARRTTLELSTLGQQFELDHLWSVPGHPMIAAIVAAHPPGVPVHIEIASGVPSGSGMGTSAAVGVALLAALRVLQGMTVDIHALAVEAHSLETAGGLESGVQDHVAAAFGGVCEIDVRYPQFHVTSVDLAADVRAALRHRLLSVYLGRPHRSHDIHQAVIKRLCDGDPEPLIAPLRISAEIGAAALRAGDLRAYASVLRESVELQRNLDPRLIGPDADRLVRWCHELGAAAKVNGAGGDGGSVTVLLPDDGDARRRLVARIRGVARWRSLDLQPSAGGVTVVGATWL